MASQMTKEKQTFEAQKELLPIIRPDSTKVSGSNEHDGITITDALTLTKFGKFNYFLIFVSGMIMNNVLLETAPIGFVMPIAQCDLQMTNQQKGILSATSFVGICMSSHLWGFLSDTKGRRRVIRPTLIAGFMVSFLASFSHKFWIMVLLRLINGFIISGSSATIYAYLGEFHTNKTRSRAIMASSVIFSVGALILPLTAFIVINQDWTLTVPILGIVYKPWRLFLVLCALPGLLCGLSLYILPESPKFLLSIGREEKAIEVLQKMHRWNGGREELKIKHILPEEDVVQLKMDSSKSSNFFLALLQAMWYQTVPLFNKRYLRITLIVSTIQFWLYFATHGFYMWFPHIINSMVEFMQAHPDEDKQICQIMYDKQESLYKDDGSMDCITKLENTTYIYSLILDVLYIVGFAVIGLVINRISKVTVLFIIMTFFAGCGLAAIILVDPSISVYLYILLFMVGVGISVLGTVTVELYPTHLRGMAICISLMIGRIGSVVGTNIAGALLGNNCELSFYIVGCSLIGCAFLVLVLPRKSLEETTKTGAEES